MPLTDTALRQLKSNPHARRQKLADSGGLYLLIDGPGRYWRLDYTYAQRRKTLALGVYPVVSLAQARRMRDEAKSLLVENIDPMAAKRERKQAAVAAADSTFESVARAWLKKTKATRKAITDDKLVGWLERDVYPSLGRRAISELGPRDVLAVVRRIEDRGSIDTAHRILQLCSRIFRFAVAGGQADRDVTVDLRGALSAVPKNHHAAITDPAPFGALLRAIEGYKGNPVVASALKLAPLVFVRPGELRHAEWSEVDLERREWRIPAEKMKMKLPHLVPLSRQACELLKNLMPISGNGKYLFPGLRTRTRPISDNTLNAALRNLGYAGDTHTSHGFRASARTMLDEILGERVDLIEHQLAHAVKDPNGRAYNRTSHLEARQLMMQRWADYLDAQKEGPQKVEVRGHRVRILAKQIQPSFAPAETTKRVRILKSATCSDAR